jgi:hypothetical protein
MQTKPKQPLLKDQHVLTHQAIAIQAVEVVDTIVLEVVAAAQEVVETKRKCYSSPHIFLTTYAHRHIDILKKINEFIYCNNRR